MNVSAFLQGYTRVLATSFQDGPFESLRLQVHGMSSPRTAKLLNFAAQHLGPKEYYLEIGTFTGYTLLSAKFETSVRSIAIDNFALYLYVNGKAVPPFEQLKENIHRFGSGFTNVLAQDFRQVDLQAELDQGRKAGVFFIDAEHTAKDVTDSFAWAERYLADEAIIVLDDTNAVGVTEAMREWLKDHPNYEEVFYCKTAPGKCEGTQMDWLFHNGIAIVRYHRA